MNSPVNVTFQIQMQSDRYSDCDVRSFVTNRVLLQR